MYGEIPKTIGQLKRLKVLQLQLNKFSGELPIELGNLPRIKSIYLNNNRFYGELNASIFEGLTTLSQLALNRNQFSGPFPTSFLSILRFRKLRLENNYFDTTPHWHEYPTHLKFSLRMGLKQYRFRPQKEGTPPQQILPDYTEFPETHSIHPTHVANPSDR
ncbi:L domain-like protein [Rhizoclosmatium globosum]|uniref:L domain-like protein n=1 Tax=Rhizoclosmatium globosum TaxID=329046 RepID=A0A1Y2B543_9FUNG|nr:L domain-like protein [Rhizoclosmatium globosum]|eukprot:ORY29943.1 L domain-like protein [Rhizoclosmatium globosum]